MRLNKKDHMTAATYWKATEATGMAYEFKPRSICEVSFCDGIRYERKRQQAVRRRMLKEENASKATTP
jgi:hypothetical protein